MIPFLRGVEYVGSYARFDDCSAEMKTLPLVVFTGRSNAGKDSSGDDRQAGQGRVAGAAD